MLFLLLLPMVLQLVHHGVRCAHLYLAQSQAELPGLLGAVTAARELRAANQQVRGWGLNSACCAGAVSAKRGGMASCML